MPSELCSKTAVLLKIYFFQEEQALSIISSCRDKICTLKFITAMYLQ